MSCDRRQATLCIIHLVPFVDCPCEERRNTTDAPIQLMWCEACDEHFTLCQCPQPDLQPRSAA